MRSKPPKISRMRYFDGMETATTKVSGDWLRRPDRQEPESLLAVTGLTGHMMGSKYLPNERGYTVEGEMVRYNSQTELEERIRTVCEVKQPGHVLQMLGSLTGHEFKSRITTITYPQLQPELARV